MPKKHHATLTEGTVVSSSIDPPETMKGVITRIMKIVSIERTPNHKIARIQLKAQGSEFDIHIDEPTAKAIAAVFDEPSQPPIEEVLAEINK